jgi:hypothetical protein
MLLSLKDFNVVVHDTVSRLLLLYMYVFIDK